MVTSASILGPGSVFREPEVCYGDCSGRTRPWNRTMLKKILLCFASLLGLVLVVGLALPSHYRVERSTLVRAPAEAIHPRVADLARWAEWSPWTPEHFPDTEWRFGGGVGAGAVRSWSSARTGPGTLSLTRADKTGVDYDTSMQGGYLMRGRLAFTPEAAGTRVTWVEEGSVGANPLAHYLVPLVRARLGDRFEWGLARLQRQVEASPLSPELPPAPPEERAAAPVPAPETPPSELPSQAPVPATPPEVASGAGLPVSATPGATPAAEVPVTDSLDAGPPPVAAAPGDASVPTATAPETPPEGAAPPQAAPPAPASTSVAGPAVPPS